MTKEAAAQFLYDNVQVPVFFDRLRTHWGIQPSDEAEMRIMLKTAADLVLLHERDRQQQRAAGNSFLQKAASLVSKQVQEAYPDAYNELPQQIKQAATAAAARPELIEACLAVQG